MEQRFININRRQGIWLWSYLYMCKYRCGGGRAENAQRPCYRNRPVHVYPCSGSKALSHIRPPFSGRMWWAKCSEESYICVMPISSKGMAKEKCIQRLQLLWKFSEIIRDTVLSLHGLLDIWFWPCNITVAGISSISQRIFK